jgi:hypothetical protein
MDVKKPAAEVPAVENGAEPHPDYAGLTRSQVAGAHEKARKSLVAAREKAALKRAELDEMNRIEREEGVVADGVLGEVVTIESLDLAINTPWLQIDGKRYHNGKPVTARRSVINDLLYMADRTHINEASRLGVDRFAFYQEKRAPVITHVGGKNIQVLKGTG